ncbi:MAG TPA: DUF222 domain-containing protein [Tetrasphaera sp.]|nr:DUF222 domain-containing protein [Tetrasphaera sp.]
MKTGRGRAAGAPAELRQVLWQAPGGALGEILGQFGELALIADAAEVAVIAETLQRGEHTSGEAPLAIGDWVCSHSRRYPTGATCARSVKLARHIAKKVLPDRLAEAVLSGQAPVAPAAVAADEMQRLLPDLQPGFVAAGWDAYTELALAGDVGEVRKLRPALIAKYGDGDKGKDEERDRSRACLSGGASDGGALVDYRLSLDAESAAVLEGALGSLTRPVPGPDGEPDPRPWTNRRAHALIDLLNRATKKSDGDVVLGRSSTHTTVIVDAPSPAAPGLRTGPMHTTRSTGPTVGIPISTTQPSCAGCTTASSTPDISPRRSRPGHRARRTTTESGLGLTPGSYQHAVAAYRAGPTVA